jgi:hypothetical protein
MGCTHCRGVLCSRMKSEVHLYMGRGRLESDKVSYDEATMYQRGCMS